MGGQASFFRVEDIGSDLDPIPQSLKANTDTHLKAGHDLFLSHPSQFISTNF